LKKSWGLDLDISRKTIKGKEKTVASAQLLLPNGNTIAYPERVVKYNVKNGYTLAFKNGTNVTVNPNRIDRKSSVTIKKLTFCQTRRRLGANRRHDHVPIPRAKGHGKLVGLSEPLKRRAQDDRRAAQIERAAPCLEVYRPLNITSFLLVDTHVFVTLPVGSPMRYSFQIYHLRKLVSVTVLSVWLATGSVSIVCAVPVTLQVNMQVQMVTGNFNPAADTVEVRGFVQWLERWSCAFGGSGQHEYLSKHGRSEWRGRHPGSVQVCHESRRHRDLGERWRRARRRAKSRVQFDELGADFARGLFQ
jgi:hypothetical protein